MNVTPYEAVKQVIEVAMNLQNYFEVDKNTALAKAIDVVEPFYGRTLEPLRQLLKPIDCNTKPVDERINKVLSVLGA